MKILYVDTSLEGHHEKYFAELCKLEGTQKVFVLPEKLERLPFKQYTYTVDFTKKSPLKYLKYMSFIKKVARKEKVDVIHFLNGDAYYSYFGIGFKGLKVPVIVTFHHVHADFLHKISIKRIFNKIHVGVVHTCSLKQQLTSWGISSVFHVEYPYFEPLRDISPLQSRAFFGIKDASVKVISCVGGTRLDKGLDILLRALQKVQNPFILLIAGAESGLKREQIESISAIYSEKVALNLRYLTDEELYHAVNAADIIALPYRKIFDGASGPLTEGVAMGKTILGAGHGSLGSIIRDNHIGYTFESEDENSLAEVLEKALGENFVYDETAKAYRESLSPEDFKKKYHYIYEETVKNNERLI